MAKICTELVAHLLSGGRPGYERSTDSGHGLHGWGTSGQRIRRTDCRDEATLIRRPTSLLASTGRGVPPSLAGKGLSLIHISEPTRLGMISYAVFCLKKKNK